MTPAGTAAPASGMPGPEQRRTIQLRSGVVFPDWSAASSPSVRAALMAMLEAAWDRRAWQDYTAAEDAVRRTILELYRDLGRAPSRQEIALRVGLPPGRVTMLMERLTARDLIVREGDEIVGAYPLSDWSAEHRVRIGERTVHAMCAIDALGVSAMYRTDVTIESRCRWCSAPIEIATRARGQALARVSPHQAVVFASISYRGCAATSLCTEIAFLCGEAHLSASRSSPSPGGPTFALSIDEALEVGRAIFGPVLAAPRLEEQTEPRA